MQRGVGGGGRDVCGGEGGMEVLGGDWGCFVVIGILRVFGIGYI